jgi:hypothetical protein
MPRDNVRVQPEDRSGAAGLSAVVPLTGKPLAQTVPTNELTALAALAASIAAWIAKK